MPSGPRAVDAPTRELQRVIPSGSQRSKPRPKSSMMGHRAAWARALMVQVLPKLARPYSRSVIHSLGAVCAACGQTSPRPPGPPASLGVVARAAVLWPVCLEAPSMRAMAE